MSFDDLEYKIGLKDYLCMLAVAYDRQERDRYWAAMSTLIPQTKKGMKAFPWGSPDKGGTVNLSPKKKNMESAKAVSQNVARMSGIGEDDAIGRISRTESYFERRVLFKGEGGVFDKDWKSVSDVKPHDLVLPIESHPRYGANN